MEGTSAERSLIDIGATTKKHSKIVPQLLAAHALSGCDTVAQMSGIGKARVVKVLKNGLELSKIGDPAVSIANVIKEATVFIATCYGTKAKDDMSKARYEKWLSKVANRKVTTAPKLRSFPPTSEAFAENVKRAHLQTSIWKSALDEYPPDLNPSNFGWVKDTTSKSLSPVTVPQDVLPAPPEILQIISCGCSRNEACSTCQCGCRKGQLACTVFCKCTKEGNCHNPWTKYATEPSDDDHESDSDRSE
jgi:hypothetical protein